MKIPKTSKVELVACKEESRYILAHPWLDVEKKLLVATSGKHLVALPVTVEEHDTSGRVTPDALKMARKLTKTDVATIECNGGYKFTNGATLPRPEAGGQYPNWQQVMTSDEEDGQSIAFDARLLLDIQEAFGSAFVTITLRKSDHELGVMKVTPSGSNAYPGLGAVGLLMPARMS